MNQGSSGHGAHYFNLSIQGILVSAASSSEDRESKKYAIHCPYMYFYAILVLFQGLSYLIVLEKEGDHGADM